jgi:hypothetical protein
VRSSEASDGGNLALKGRGDVHAAAFRVGWSHPERVTKDVLKIRTSFLKNPRPPYCVLEKHILAVDLDDTLNDEIRGIDLGLGTLGTKSCTLPW